MASPITWRALPSAWSNLTCHQCSTQIPEGQPCLVRSFGRRYARFWCCACKARLDLDSMLDTTAATA